MKVCEQSCYRLYDDDAGFCPIDGKPLKPVSEAKTPTDSTDPRIGSTICDGRFQVWRKVADGGMGRVYQALDIPEDRSVALKVLHSEVAQDEVAVERFKREYALSAELPHEHIVEVLDFKKTEDDSFALVMEYLEGEELRMQLGRDKILSHARVVRMLSQLALGLKEPHRLKVVHRDIKPDNVFLCDTEQGPVVKLLDFGSVRDNSEGAKKLTVVGTTIGSPFYMSPEQAQGLPELDHRADVWSLAAIAYECMTGKVPFYGTTGPSILLAILGKEPVPPSIAGSERNIPEAMDDVIADALAKEPATRLGSVTELADRFGHSFGLEGDHADWAYLPESELKVQLENAVRAPPAARSIADTISDDAASEKHPAAAGPSAPSGNPFGEDEEFIMGVPDRRPMGMYIALGAVGLLIAVVAVAALLL